MMLIALLVRRHLRREAAACAGHRHLAAAPGTHCHREGDPPPLPALRRRESTYFIEERAARRLQAPRATS
jgi:hypothetical protein